jgi:hypothetical protein
MKVIYREVCLDLQHPANPPEPESLSFLPDPCPLFRNTSLSPGPWLAAMALFLSIFQTTTLSRVPSRSVLIILSGSKFANCTFFLIISTKFSGQPQSSTNCLLNYLKYLDFSRSEEIALLVLLRTEVQSFVISLFYVSKWIWDPKKRKSSQTICLSQT